MSDTNLPQPDLEGFLKSGIVDGALRMVQSTGEKDYGVAIPLKEYKTGLAQFLNGPSLKDSQAKVAIKEKPSATRQYAIRDALYEQYDIILVEATHTLYYKSKQKTTGWDDSRIYRIFPDFVQRRELIKAALTLNTPIRIDAREARATAETLLDSVGADDESRIKQHVDNAVIQITNNLFWDGHVGKLTDKPTHEAYRRLFDTTSSGGDTVKWTLEQEAEWNSKTNEAVLKGYYNRSLAILKQYNGKFPQNDDHKYEKGGAPWMEEFLPYIMDWADGDYDTYMDLLRAIASCFLKNKIRGAYFLIGAGANGKSAFNDLLRTLFGRNNCARLSLEQLNNSHKNMALASCIVNLPDEQKDIAMEHQEIFKSMTAHQDIELDVFYAQAPQPVVCDFMCFFPMNHMPKWGGSGSKACLDRCWPIFFKRDFSKLGTQVKNFQQDTYTPENMKMLVPVVLALATYHSEHPLERSPTMEVNRGVVEMETSSATTYRNKAFSLFNAFKNIKWLYQDYMAWCDDNEIPYQKLGEFKTFILTSTREEWVYIPAINKTEKCLVTAGWSKEKSCVFHPDSVMDARGIRMRDLYAMDKEDEQMRSAVTIKEAILDVKEVKGEPDQLPPEKSKSSEQLVKGYRQRRASGSS